MFIVIHMWKCRKVRTALPKIHLQKYMVSEAANYWAKKAVCFNTYMHKKRKTAHTLWWVFIMLVYRNKEKKIHLFWGSSFFFPTFLWYTNWPGCHGNTFHLVLTMNAITNRKWQSPQLHREETCIQIDNIKEIKQQKPFICSINNNSNNDQINNNS